MCERGDTVVMHFRGRDRDIDHCIASLVGALNDSGFGTVASCCGHGQWPGRISMDDGRELVIMPNFESAAALDTRYPTICGDITDPDVEQLLFLPSEN